MYEYILHIIQIFSIYTGKVTVYKYKLQIKYNYDNILCIKLNGVLWIDVDNYRIKCITQFIINI